MGMKNESHLKDHRLWDEPMAIDLAKDEGLILESDHWTFIFAYRNYYLEHQKSYSIRQLNQQLKSHWADPLQLSIRLHQLFPQGAKQVAKIAGLPKPNRCL